MNSYELSEEAEADLRSEHTRLRVLRGVITLTEKILGPGRPEIRIDVALKPASDGAWKRFRKQQGNEKTFANALTDLLRDTCVFPAKADLAAVLADFPGLPETCNKAMMELAGYSLEESGKE